MTTANQGTRVLVLNSGSSSVKYQLLDMFDSSRLAVGLVERIGEETSRLKHTPLATGGSSREQNGPIADHAAALKAVAAELAADGLGLDSPELAAIGHRVVHGGLKFSAPTVITDEVMAEIERLVPVAPLHNPANITGIRTAQALRPDLPQVAVFDTAFHTTMPESAARYAIDVATADEHRIRRYGFHGTSHAYVSRETAKLLGKAPEDVNVIVLHLGNGASASAVRGGRCVDTSMGLTPSKAWSWALVPVTSTRRSPSISSASPECRRTTSTCCSTRRAAWWACAATMTCGRSAAAATKATRRHNSPSTSTFTA